MSDDYAEYQPFLPEDRPAPIDLDRDNISAYLTAPPSVAEHLRAAREAHETATERYREARNFEKWPTYSYKGAFLRDDAIDDHLAATDTLHSAVAELLGMVRELSAQQVALLELLEARDAQANGEAA